MKVLQINTTKRTGSTGRISEDLAVLLKNTGNESIIAAAWGPSSNVTSIAIGTTLDRFIHRGVSLFFDRHGFSSEQSTKAFLSQIEKVAPDIIHLHNIHGYYLHVGVLFDFLKKYNRPVVWTFHDCWPFTGHCSYFDRVSCYKWQSECHQCPNLKGYPKSLFIDQSNRNFFEKKAFFTNLDKLIIVTPSKWLAGHVSNSFFGNCKVRVIPNGVNLNLFKPNLNSDTILAKYGIYRKGYYLGVASIWDKRKGLEDFIKMSSLLHINETIVLVGLSNSQLKNLPNNIIGIPRTENVSELAAIYSAAVAFLNPSTIDNFPTTNIEALSCGTPVVTYNTGGSPEAIDKLTGNVVRKGEIGEMLHQARLFSKMDRDSLSTVCRNRAVDNYDITSRYMEYINLYKEMMSY